MPINGEDIYDIRRGMITAPAGCGKTQLIIAALAAHNHSKPVLVLTHTNAGVAAIKSRMQRLGVSPKSCKIATLDGFSMRMAGTFPLRSGVARDTLLLNNAAKDYPAIREATLTLLRSRHIDDIIGASYCHLIVDEYQDCNLEQHNMICELARTLPTCLLGDPLQAIFGFNGLPVEWDRQVCVDFPVIEELETPWRWINAGAQPLGEWILSCRPALLLNGGIDIRSAPAQANWVELANNPAIDRARIHTAASTRGEQNDSVLIIGDSRNPASRHQIASTVAGASTVETVDLRDLTTFGRTFDPQRPDALNTLLAFGQSLMTGVSIPEITARIRTLQAGRARTAADTSEQAILEFLSGPNMGSSLKILKQLPSVPSRRVYRKHIYNLALKAMEITNSGARDFSDACILIREQNRAQGRPLPRRAVGSTLLLKGLEAEIAILLNAGEFSGKALDSKNLYVAMSRGSKRVVFCSSSPILNAHDTERRTA